MQKCRTKDHNCLPPKATCCNRQPHGLQPLQPPACSRRGSKWLFVIDIGIHRGAEWQRVKEREEQDWGQELIIRASPQQCSTSHSFAAVASYQRHDEAHFPPLLLTLKHRWKLSDSSRGLAALVPVRAARHPH